MHCYTLVQYATNRVLVHYLPALFLQNLLFKKINGLDLNHNPFIPGLEVKYALEEASKLNSKLVFMGPELSEETANKIKHEKNK